MSCLNVYLPCCCDTLKAPKICAVVHTSLLYRAHLASVVILHLLMQLETKGSWEFLISKRLLIFEAFSDGGKLLIGNGLEDTEK